MIRYIVQNDILNLNPSSPGYAWLHTTGFELPEVYFYLAIFDYIKQGMDTNNYQYDASGNLLFAQVMYDSPLSPDGGNPNNEVNQMEFVMVKNMTDQPINLENVKLTNTLTAESLDFPDQNLPPGAVLVTFYGGDDELGDLIGQGFLPIELFAEGAVIYPQIQLTLPDQEGKLVLEYSPQDTGNIPPGPNVWLDEVWYGQQHGLDAENAYLDTLDRTVPNYWQLKSVQTLHLPNGQANGFYANNFIIADINIPKDIIPKPKDGPGFASRWLDFKLYELKDHLGNVRATVGDRKLLTGTPGVFQADLKSYNHYYPFGWLQPGRQFNSTDYRYGFNGMEMDNEISGAGSHLGFGDHGYSPRLGRRWNLDKFSYLAPHLSPYRAFNLSPISIYDIDGNVERDAKTKRIIFRPIGTVKDFELGDGQIGTFGTVTFGYITANDGKTQLLVVRVDEIMDFQYSYDEEGMQHSKTFLTKNFNSCNWDANCYGTVLADNQYVVADNLNNIRAFIKADGYELIKSTGQVYSEKSVKVGDILFFPANDHIIRATSKDKEGNIIWETHFAGDFAYTGTLEEITKYHFQVQGAALDAKNAELFSTNKGDTFIDFEGQRSLGGPPRKSEGARVIGTTGEGEKVSEIIDFED